jgi:hypothetical protein
MRKTQATARITCRGSKKATRMLWLRFASASLICHVNVTGIEGDLYTQKVSERGGGQGGGVERGGGGKGARLRGAGES